MGGRALQRRPHTRLKKNERCWDVPAHPTLAKHTSTDLKEYTLHKLASADTHQIENTNDYNATLRNVCL